MNNNSFDSRNLHEDAVILISSYNTKEDNTQKQHTVVLEKTTRNSIYTLRKTLPTVVHTSTTPYHSILSSSRELQ